VKFHRAYLKSREAIGLDPLPEEMTGVVGPDPVDDRDRYKPELAGCDNPRSFSLTDEVFLKIRHQGRGNSCTGHAAATAAELITGRMQTPRVAFDPMVLYWYNRLRSGFDPRVDDGGAYVRTAMQTLHKNGAMKRSDLNPLDDPYRLGEMSDDVFRIKAYERIPIYDGTAEQVRRILAVEKLPIVAGLRTYKSNNARKDGRWEVPHYSEMPQGAHAVVLTGYVAGYIEFANSWGTGWGRNGFGYVHQDFLTDMIHAVDLWAFTPEYF